jgi:hypothetical protein
MVEDKLLELGRAIEAKAKTGQSTLFKADNASVLGSYDESGRLRPHCEQSKRGALHRRAKGKPAAVAFMFLCEATSCENGEGL